LRGEPLRHRRRGAPGHRASLDKDTSGLLVVAKTDQAHRGLSEQFADHGREGELERGYLALVWGAPPRPHGTIDAPIGRHKTSRTKMAIIPVARGGREAVTHYQVVATFGHGPEPIACDFVFLSDGLKDKVRGLQIDSETRASDHQPVALELG